MSGTGHTRLARVSSLVVFAVLVSAAFGAHFFSVRVARDAHAKYRASYSAASWTVAIQSAREAVRLRPDIPAYRQRAIALQAQQYVRIGALGKARSALIDALSLTDPPSPGLRARLAQVNSEIFLRDARKAHVLHGREKPGGVLESDDLMP